MGNKIEVIVRGARFSSIKSACGAYGISRVSVGARMNKYGESPEVAIEHCISERKMAWTEEEDRILRDRYSIDGTKIPQLKNRSSAAIINRAKQLGVRKLSKREEWTAKDIEILYREYPIKGKNIPELLGKRGGDAIAAKAQYLGIKAETRWSKEEIDILKDKYPTQGTNIPELLKTRGRSAVCLKAAQLGMAARVKWNEHEDKLIKKLYPTLGANIPELVNSGRTKRSISARARELGVKTNCRVVMNQPDVKRYNTVWKDYVVIECAKCHKRYILNMAEAMRFSHRDCSRLRQTPDGWRLPRQLLR